MAMICDEPDSRDSLLVAHMVLEFLKDITTNLNEDTILSREGITGMWYMLDYVSTVCKFASDAMD